MGRLIDENTALQRFIQETEESGKNVIHINTIKRILQDVDTAYDVEKVALELRHLAFRLPKDYCGLDGKDRAVMFDDAIDIVRKGGVE